MARLGLSLLILSTLLVLNTANPINVNSRSHTTRPKYPTDFIRASCKATTYPALCVQSLAAFAKQIRKSERQLAQAALRVSLSRARSASKFVSKMTKVRGIKPREYQAVKDCIETMGDTVDRLSQSVRELGQVGQDFLWHMSNVQTWVSAALTDENTCLDGFSGRAMDGNVKAAIRRRVVDVAQVTSNALALVNRFASKHGPNHMPAQHDQP